MEQCKEQCGLRRYGAFYQRSVCLGRLWRNQLIYSQVNNIVQDGAVDVGAQTYSEQCQECPNRRLGTSCQGAKDGEKRNADSSVYPEEVQYLSDCVPESAVAVLA